jgi:hypothetical protein
MEYYYNTIPFIDIFLHSFLNEIEQNTVEITNPPKGWRRDDCLTLRQGELLSLLKNVVTVSSFFGVESFDERISSLTREINELETALRLGSKVGVTNSLKFLRKTFESPTKELAEKLALLDEDEKVRLNEAFNCYVNDLYYSAIVISVSSIESRLNLLLKSDAKLKMTLGELISEYLKNEDKYQRIIPKKHLQLLHYCNTYRVLTAHPLKEQITKANATAILCMTCSFLFDKDLKI